MNIIYHYKSINISIDSQDIACDWSCIYMPTQQTQSPQNTIHSPIYKNLPQRARALCGKSKV